MCQLFARFTYIGADISADLDLALQEFVHGTLPHQHLAFCHELLRRSGGKFAGLLIDKQIFFFDADR